MFKSGVLNKELDWLIGLDLVACISFFLRKYEEALYAAYIWQFRQLAA